MSNSSKSELIVAIIDFYRNNPCLWSSKHPQHKNRDHCNNLLNKFGQSLCPVLSAHQIDSKWVTIKTSYSKTKKEIQIASRSGSGLSGKKIWKHFDKCSFLNEQLEPVRQAVDISDYVEPNKSLDESNEKTEVILIYK
jgi:hypothetical protein